MSLRKTCAAAGCTVLLPVGTTRCPGHALPKRGAQHRRASNPVVKSATVCWICNLPPTSSDPLTADHIIPRALGGLDITSNYRAAHRSCNSRRGSKL